MKTFYRVPTIRDEIEINLDAPLPFDMIDPQSSQALHLHSSIPQPIRHGRHIRSKEDHRLIGNVHTHIPSFEMDFIESPLLPKESTDSSALNSIITMQRQVDQLRERRQKKRPKKL